MYTDFASVYDRLMQDVPYAAWAAYYAKLMGQAGIPKDGMVCECACGSGSLTIPLQEMGYRMTGIDLSREMLDIAAKKARKAGCSIPFVCQDMRELQLHRRVHAILATCDGVNYLLHDEDAAAFFSRAFQSLRPGGGLFFDVSTPYKLKNDLGNQLLCEDAEDITYVWQNSFSPKSETVSMHLCFFVRQENGMYIRLDEEQQQRAYDIATLTKLLRDAGFDQITVTGDRTGIAPTATERRWHFAALKPAEEEIDL